MFYRLKLTKELTIIILALIAAVTIIATVTITACAFRYEHAGSGWYLDRWTGTVGYRKELK
jgi:hypothetical protein